MRICLKELRETYRWLKVIRRLRHSNKTCLEYKEPLHGAILIDFSASLEMTNWVLLEPLKLISYVDKANNVLIETEELIKIFVTSIRTAGHRKK